MHWRAVTIVRSGFSTYPTWVLCPSLVPSTANHNTQTHLSDPRCIDYLYSTYCVNDWSTCLDLSSLTLVMFLFFQKLELFYCLLSCVQCSGAVVMEIIKGEWLFLKDWCFPEVNWWNRVTKYNWQCWLLTYIRTERWLQKQGAQFQTGQGLLDKWVTGLRVSRKRWLSSVKWVSLSFFITAFLCKLLITSQHES